MIFGCIGCGNMGSAILNGIGKLANDLEMKENKFELIGYDHHDTNLKALSKSCGMHACKDEFEVAMRADIILIAVKPYMVDDVVKKISPALTKNKVIISLAAGVSFARIKSASNNGVCGSDKDGDCANKNDSAYDAKAKGACPIVIIMPNTPAMVGKGCCALCFDDASLPEAKKMLIQKLFSKIAITTVLKEEQLPQFSALLGSGPAFVFYMQEAMMEAAIRLGFKYDEAKVLVDKLFEGSANLAQSQPDINHAKLRMNVCSPKGSSIVGMNALDKNGVRSGIIEAVLATHERAKEMANEK